MTDLTEQIDHAVDDLRTEILSANSFADLEKPLLLLNRQSLDQTDKNTEYLGVLNVLEEKVRTLTLSRNGGPLLVELLLIAPIAARLDTQIPSQDVWIEIAKSAFNSLDSSDRYALDEILPWLLFNSLARGCTGSLCDLISLPGRFTVDPISHIRPQLVQKVLSEGQWLREVDVVELSLALKKRVSQLREEYDVNKLLFLSNFLSTVFPFTRQQSTEVLHVYFFELFAEFLDLITDDKVIKQIPPQELLRLLLKYDGLTTFEIVKNLDTAEHFALIMNRIMPAMAKGGAHCGNTLMGSKRFRTISDFPTVGFVLHSSHRLAHTEALITFLRGFKTLKAPGFEPVVLILEHGSGNRTFRRAFENLGIRVLNPSGSKAPKEVAITDWLARTVATNNIDGLVFVSLPTYLTFWANFRVTPFTVWWSMKFHNIEIPGVDQYMTVASYDRYREIHGRKWRGVRSATGPLFDESISAEAAEVRARYENTNDTVIIGCMAREERINDKAYIDTIAKIMQRCPNAVFVWTGRHRLRQIDDMLKSHGIFERSHFIGWVDTKLWAQVIDVYVDTFPFASGQTGLEAMAANTPVVLLRSPEAAESSTLTLIGPLLDQTAGSKEEQRAAADIFKPYEGQSTAPVSDSIDEFVDRAVALIQDENFRTAAGNAGRTFTDTFCRDEKRFAEDVNRHMEEIIEEARTKSTK